MEGSNTPGLAIDVPPPAARSLRRLLVPGITLLLLTTAGLGALASLGRPATVAPLVPSRAAVSEDRLAQRERATLAALDRLRPRGVYLVVDSHRNRLFLFRGDEKLREAVCSTGTGNVVRDPRTGRTWIFDTPLGERVVERKVRNPIWAKPDWAFIEEGLEPPKDPNERFDSVSLGNYALYIGDGYIIHGTVFKSLLGRRATHGCIRLGDEDLEFVYRNAPIGTRVYLY
jgi:hypothetical protein